MSAESLEKMLETAQKAVRRYYVDVHVNMERRHHVVYDGQGCRMVKSLAEIPVEKDDEVYIDVLHARICDDALKLLQREVRVFILRKTDILSKLRAANNIEKTHENDAMVLSTLDESFYRELGVDEVRLRKLIIEYNKYSRILRAMRKWEGESKAFNEARRLIEREKHKLAREIIAVAEAAIPQYKMVCEALKLSRRSLYGKVALADMLLNIDFSRGLRKILSYLGRHQNNRKYYNKRMRMVLESLSIAYYGRFKVRAKEQVELLKTIRKLVAGDPA